MAAVAERIEVEAPVSAAEQLADLRRQIADKVAQRDLALRKQRECEADGQQHQTSIDRLPVFEDKLAALFEAKAAGDAKAAKECLAVEKDVATMREMAGRAKLELTGCRAAAKRFAKEAADADAQIDELRYEEARVRVRILIETFLASRAEYRRQCEQFAIGPMAQHFAMAAATVALAREIGLAGSELTAADLRDPEPGYAFQTSLSNTETVRGMFVDAWCFGQQAREPFARHVAGAVAQLRASLALPA